MNIKLIITGPARSGTSFLAKFITKMGYCTGGEWNDDHNYGMEHPEVAYINSLLLEGFRENWLLTIEGQKDLYNRIKNINNEVIKQPRFTTHPNIVRFWRQCIPGIKIICTTRNLISCNKSVMKMKGKTNYTVEQLKTQQSDFINTVLEMNIPMKMIFFPRFLDQYPTVYKSFNDYGIVFDYEKGLKEWNNMVDYNKVHYK